MDEAVQRYIDAIPKPKRELFDRLQAIILDLYPDAKIEISYKMPSYKVGPRRIYLGVWKRGVSLHAVDIAPFKARHPAIKTGRGSLNFTLSDEVPEADVRDAIKRSISRS